MKWYERAFPETTKQLREPAAVRPKHLIYMMLAWFAFGVFIGKIL